MPTSGSIGIYLENKYEDGNEEEPGSISGTKFNHDTGAGIGGWTIKLFKDTLPSNPASTSAFRTTTTNTSGNYSFTNLPEATYFVYEVVKSSWTAMSPASGYHEVTIPLWLIAPLVVNGGEEPIYDITEVDFYNRYNRSDDPGSITLRVIKNIVDEDGNSLNNDPKHKDVEFTITINGQTYPISASRSVTLSRAEGTRFQISETSIPEGYKLLTISDEDVTIWSGTVTVTITNEYEEEEEEEEEEETPPEPAAAAVEVEPELPRTGALDLLYLALGAAALTGGFAIRRKRK